MQAGLQRPRGTAESHQHALSAGKYEIKVHVRFILISYIFVILFMQSGRERHHLTRCISFFADAPCSVRNLPILHKSKGRGASVLRPL